MEEDDSELLPDPIDGEDDTFDDDLLTLEAMGKEVDTYHQTADVISQYGINPTVLSFLQSSTLLSGTMLGSVATETYGFHGAGDLRTEHAVESLVDKIKEKVTAWSAKIVSLVKNLSDKVLGPAKELFAGIKSKFAGVKETLKSLAGDAGEEIKTHPYRTLLAALTAALAVVGIVVFGLKNLPRAKDAAKLPAVSEKIAGMINKLDWPGGKIVGLSTKGKLTLGAIGAVAIGSGAASLTRMEWSAGAVDKITTLCDRIFEGLKSAWSALVPVGQAVVEDAKMIGGNLQKAYYGGASAVEDKHQERSETHQSFLTNVAALPGVFVVGVMSILYVLYKLAKGVIIASFKITNAVFDKLGGLGSDSKSFV